MSVQFGPVEFDDQHTAATISIDKKIYSKSAVLRACYWFGKDLYCHVKERDDLLEVTVGLRVSSPTLDQPKNPSFMLRLSRFHLASPIPTGEQTISSSR